MLIVVIWRWWNSGLLFLHSLYFTVFSKICLQWEHIDFKIIKNITLKNLQHDSKYPRGQLEILKQSSEPFTQTKAHKEILYVQQ